MCHFIPSYVVDNIFKNQNKIKASTIEAFKSYFVGIYGNTIDNQNKALGDGKETKLIRTVYDAKEERNRGTIVRSEGRPPTQDDVVNNAYDFSGYTWKFFKEIFGRNSINNKGMQLHSTVHYGIKYPNAFWDGTFMTYGDGDGEIFKNFVVLDVVAHELGHGVTEHSGNGGLVYYGQSGALNESFSDVFGSMVKQWVRKQSAVKADWIIGEGLLSEKINGKGIRSMSDPGNAYNDKILGKDRQPSHIRDIYTGPDDSGGVHINSSLINKPFCEFAKNLGGYSWEKAGRVWYEVLRTKLYPNANFQNMVDATQEVVIQNYGTGIELRALKEAWATVGLKPKHYVFNQYNLNK